MANPRSSRRLHAAVVHAVVALVALLLVATIWAYGALVALLKAGPVLDRGRLQLLQNVQILDREGGLLYQFAGSENRVFLPTESIPDVLKNAAVAIEDERFYSRSPCVDTRSVLRALWTNLTTDKIQGASTITQQLVRMLYLSPEKTLKRKFYEVILSCRLESLLSKDEIITLYLNGVGFGSGLYGVEQASKAYFGLPAESLTVAQAAMLAAIPQRPTYYSPYGLHERTSIDHDALQRLRKGESTLEEEKNAIAVGLLPRTIVVDGKNVRLLGRSDAVIDAMHRLQFIDDKQEEAARGELLRMNVKKLWHPISAPHFALWMRAEVESLLQTVEHPERWKAAGLTVRTTLDPSLQFLAEDTLQRHAELLSKNLAKNAALVAIDHRTREVVAYVGNVDFFGNAEDGQIDMARVPRQPGSSFKPLVYAAAFERGYTPDTLVSDSPIRIGTDEPKDYDGGFLGRITVRKAIGMSRNIPAILAFYDAGGEDRVLELGSQVGVVSPLERKQHELLTNPHFTYGWPMAIGAVEVPLTEMVQMYAAIAEHGTFLPERYVCSVTDRTGKVSVPMFQPTVTQAIAKQAADGVDSILRDGDSKPEGYWRSILTIPGLDVGAKTGTSNLCFQRDVFGSCIDYGVNNVWTIGYSPSLVVGVWVGNADGSALEPLADGLTVAAPIWKDFLEQAERVYDRRASCGAGEGM